MSFTLHADFEIKSSSLKEIRNFCRKIFQKNQELENEQDQMQVYRKNAVLDNKKIRDKLDQKQIDLENQIKEQQKQVSL